MAKTLFLGCVNRCNKDTASRNLWPNLLPNLVCVQKVTLPIYNQEAKISVLSATLRAPSPPPSTSTSPSKLNKGNSSSSTNVWGFSTERPMYSHDYTECCKGAGVRTRCLGFCSIDNIMEGKAGQNPSACEPDFKKIVGCMADGRNHIPCCERAQGGDSIP